MADNNQNADPNANNGNPQGDQDLDKGKDKGSENQNGDVSKVLKENENLRGTVATLTKKLNQFSEGFKKVFSEEELDDKGTKDPNKAIEILSSKVNGLEAENKRFKAKNTVHSIVDALEIDGKPISNEVKNYLKNDIEVDEPDEEKIKDIAIKKATSLMSILGAKDDNGNTKFTADNRPIQRGTAGLNNNPSSANEILEKIKKKS